MYQAADLPGGNRHRSRTANTIRVFITSCRLSVENGFARDWAWKITGLRQKCDATFLSSTKIPGYTGHPKIYIWHQVIEAIQRRYGKPCVPTWVYPFWWAEGIFKIHGANASLQCGNGTTFCRVGNFFQTFEKSSDFFELGSGILWPNYIIYYCTFNM